MIIPGSTNILGRTAGKRIEFTPPNLTFILRHKFERVWGVVLITFFACTHCVAIPSTVSPTRFTSAEIIQMNTFYSNKNMMQLKTT